MENHPDTVPLVHTYVGASERRKATQRRSRMSGTDWLFLFLIGGILLKDVIYVDDRFIIRGVTQLACLISALAWFLGMPDRRTLWKYGVLFAYIGVLILTSLVASQAVHVISQVMSLAAVVLFSIRLSETTDNNDRHTKIVFLLLLVVCVASLAYLQIAPQDTYITRTMEVRFRGILGGPAALGTAAGVLFGLSIFFARANRTLRLAALVAAIVCLYMTGSRTFWVAGAFSLMLTITIYGKSRFMILASAIVAIVILGASATLFGVVESASDRFTEASRPESIQNLTGRTTIWERAFKKYWDRPLLGNGYTLGHEAFSDLGTTRAGAPRVWNNEQFTMHSGYVQSLLDSGGFGTFLYISIIILTIGAFIKYDKDRRYPELFYTVLFLPVANFGETVIFATGTFDSVYYWYLATIAAGLRRMRIRVHEDPRD